MSSERWCSSEGWEEKGRAQKGTEWWGETGGCPALPWAIPALSLLFLPQRASVTQWKPPWSAPPGKVGRWTPGKCETSADSVLRPLWPQNFGCHPVIPPSPFHGTRQLLTLPNNFFNLRQIKSKILVGLIVCNLLSIPPPALWGRVLCNGVFHTLMLIFQFPA